MACVASLLSLGSLSISGLTYRRGRAATPYWSPKASITGGHTDDGGWKQTRHFVVENRGRGDALDVWARLVSYDGTPFDTGQVVRVPYGTVQFGEPAGISFEKIDGTPPEGRRRAGNIFAVGPDSMRTTLLIPDLPKKVEIEVFWSQLPNTHKRRRARFTLEAPLPATL